MNTALDLERSSLRPITDLDRQRFERSPVTRAVRAMGDVTQTKTATVTASDTPEVLRLSVCDAVAGLIDGTARTCAHHDVTPPVYAAAWMPGVVVCGACVGLLALPDGDPSEFRCDLCTFMCAGTTADPIYLGTLGCGPLIFQFGACRSCAATAPGGSP